MRRSWLDKGKFGADDRETKEGALTTCREVDRSLSIRGKLASLLGSASACVRVSYPRTCLGTGVYPHKYRAFSAGTHTHRHTSGDLP
jgi:hypothetical protein